MRPVPTLGRPSGELQRDLERCGPAGNWRLYPAGGVLRRGDAAELWDGVWVGLGDSGLVGWGGGGVGVGEFGGVGGYLEDGLGEGGEGGGEEE